MYYKNIEQVFDIFGIKIEIGGVSLKEELIYRVIDILEKFAEKDVILILNFAESIYKYKKDAM